MGTNLKTHLKKHCNISKDFELLKRLELYPQDSLHFEDNPRITIEYFEAESSKRIRLDDDSMNQNSDIPPLPSRDLKPKRYPSRGLIRGGQRHSNHHQVTGRPVTQIMANPNLKKIKLERRSSDYGLYNHKEKSKLTKSVSLDDKRYL